jgi:hypothetical protein
MRLLALQLLATGQLSVKYIAIYPAFDNLKNSVISKAYLH